MQLNSNILSECLFKFILFSEVKDKDKKRIYFSPSGCNPINSLNSSSRSLKYCRHSLQNFVMRNIIIRSTFAMQHYIALRSIILVQGECLLNQIKAEFKNLTMTHFSYKLFFTK